MNQLDLSQPEQRIIPTMKPELAIRLSCVGCSISLAFAAWHHPTAVNSWLFTDQGWGAEPLTLLDRIAAAVLALTGLVLLGVRRPVSGWRRSLFLASAGFLSLWVSALAVAKTLNGGAAFSHLSLPGAALRIAGPLCLLAVASNQLVLARTMLKGSIALTFLAHGWEAWMNNPHFMDLVHLSALRVFGWFGLGETWYLSDAAVEILLRCIGALDMLCAVLVLFGFRPRILLYMAAWGGITALSRMMAFGWDWWPETMLRLPHLGCPLALYFLHLRNRNMST